MMLNEQSITQALGEVVSHLRSGNLEQAELTIKDLGFLSILRTLKRPDKGPSQFVDPAQSFGSERVQQTGDHLRRCSIAISGRDGDTALREGEAAVARWSQETG